MIDGTKGNHLFAGLISSEPLRLLDWLSSSFCQEEIETLRTHVKRNLGLGEFSGFGLTFSSDFEVVQLDPVLKQGFAKNILIFLSIAGFSLILLQEFRQV